MRDLKRSMNKTLEEAAAECALNHVDETEYCFIAGANYQKSITPFSEEDMIRFGDYLLQSYTKNDNWSLWMNAQGDEFFTKELLKDYLKNKNK